MKLAAQLLVDRLRAAGEPTRLRVLALLAREELAVIELGRILEQSQPRVSRHLKLLAAAGLIERFPDGAWVFYRLSAEEPTRTFIERMLELADPSDIVLEHDLAELDAIRLERAAVAEDYFARNAAHWEEIRSLHVDEAVVEAAILRAAGPGPFRAFVDLGTGSGRMLTLIGERAQRAIGLDLSQQMLNVARVRTAEAEVAPRCELRHGDIFATGLPNATADLVIIHRVLHYLSDPAAALIEAGRLLTAGGRLLVIDFAPHGLEQLRDQHRHRRLGFSDEDMRRWTAAAGLVPERAEHLPPGAAERLTVVIWSAARHAVGARTAA